MDDFYPGWHGLADGAAMVASDVLHPHRPGFRRWDWERDEPGEWVALDPASPLIVEGVGAITTNSVAAALKRGPVELIRVTCPDELRKERALKRDPGFAPWWEMWATQEDVLYSTLPPFDAILVEQGLGQS